MDASPTTRTTARTKRLCAKDISSNMPKLSAHKQPRSAEPTPAPYNHLSTIDIPASGGHYRRMNEPVIVCGRVFRPELVQHLSQMATQPPPPGRNVLARE